MEGNRPSKRKVVVIGAAIADITGFSSNPLISDDSNPGQVKFSSGGVGRNIAENLARLNCQVELITAFGNDVYAHGLKSHCEAAGIIIENSLFSTAFSTSIYLSINNTDGNMALAISDTRIIDELNSAFLEEKKSIISAADCLVLDTNLSIEALKYLAENFSHIPIFLDLVSTTKAKKVKSLLSHVYTIKPNLIEAEHLTGKKFEEAKDLDLMLKDFIAKGIQQVFISKGDEGCYYGNEETSGVLSGKTREVVNSSGAGDAFMAGLVFAFLNDYDLEESATFATVLSLAALQSQEAVNPQLNLELANHIRQEL